MDHTLFITIRETDSEPTVEEGIEATLTFYRSGGITVDSSLLQSPATRVFSASRRSNSETDSSLEWYFHKYFDEPFSTSRAERVQSTLDRHAALIVDELRLDQKLLAETGFTQLVMEIIQGRRISRIPWEAIEAPIHWHTGIQVRVCRIVPREAQVAHLQRVPTQTNAPRRVRVLVVVARDSNDVIDPQLTSRPLVQSLQSSSDVDVDIVRPGTKERMVEFLRKNDYDVVHLDVHGIVEQRSEK